MDDGFGRLSRKGSGVRVLIDCGIVGIFVSPWTKHEGVSGLSKMIWDRQGQNVSYESVLEVSCPVSNVVRGFLGNIM